MGHLRVLFLIKLLPESTEAVQLRELEENIEHGKMDLLRAGASPFCSN